MKSSHRSFLNSLFSIVAAFLIGAVLLLVSGINPLTAYAALLKGAFGEVSYLGDTLARATPIIFTGLAVGIAFKGGIFNIGAEGQLLVGAMAAAFVGYVASPLPGWIHLPLTLLSAAVAAGIWSLVPSLLKSLKGVHEVISCIMMNYIALYLGGYVIARMRTGDLPQTPAIDPAATLPKLSDLIPAFSGSSLNVGFFLAIIAAVVIYFVVNKSVFGYENNAMGISPTAAENSGINMKRQIILVMLVSGMLSGFAGGERVMGVYHSYLSGVSSNFGFEGIAVALLAGNNPLGIIVSAILFGALASGGQYMNLAADVPIDIVGIIQGLIILFAATSNLLPFLKKRKQPASKQEVLA